MTIQRSRFAAVTSALALMLTGLVGIQPASAATLSVAPILSITGVTAELQAGTGTWSGGTTRTTFFVCASAKTASTEALTYPSGGLSTISSHSNCERLGTTGARTTDFTGGDITTAFVGPNAPYDLTAIASRSHVVVVSINTDNGTTVYSASASQRFSLAPAYTGSLAFSLSGSVLTITEPTWGTGSPTSASNPTYEVFGCSVVSFGVFTPTTGNVTSCNRLDFASTSGSTRDLSTATNAGTSYDFATSGDKVIVLASVTGWNGLTFRIWTRSQVYPAAVPVVPTAITPVFTIENSGAISITTPASWTGADNGSARTDVVACMDAKATAVSTPANPGTFNAGCTELWASTATLQNMVSPTTMEGAKIFDGTDFVDFDPTVHGSHISLFSYARYSSVLWGVAAATQQYQVASDSPALAEAIPFTGPIVQAPGALSPVASGAKVVLEGSNLSGISSASIGGKDASVKINSAVQLELTVPAGLAPGTYDLVVTSDSGVLTVQGAITVSESSITPTSGSATPSTKRMGDGTAKVWVFDVVGAGKVQIFVNGKEIAWVNATDTNDSKLFNGYLVRTVELAEGKNVIEVFVDGERERRTVYSN